MAPPGWKNRLNAREAEQQREARQNLLMLEASAVKKHDQAPSAIELVNARKALLAHVKEIAASGGAKWIIALERDIVENDLDRYTHADLLMTGSLKAALDEIAAIERQLEFVDDPEKYKAVNEAHSLSKNRNRGLPLDEARQSFRSHRARLGNQAKTRMDDIEKQIIHARRTALGAAERDYINRQARTLGVAPAGV